MDLSFVAIDVETANPDRASICQVGAVAVRDGEIIDTLDVLVDPETYFDPWNVEIHGISESMVRGEPRFPAVARRLREFVGECVVASHTPFDRTACDRAHERYELQTPDWTWLDTAMVSRRAWTQFAARGYGLSNVAKHCGIEFQHHSAVEDARAAALILLKACSDTGLDVPAWLGRASQAVQSISRDGQGDGPLAGEVIVFTGTLSVPRSQAAAEVASFGCDVRKSVSRSTTILVVGQQDLQALNGYTKSSKQRKAEDLARLGVGIRILGEDDLRRMGQGV